MDHSDSVDRLHEEYVTVAGLIEMLPEHLRRTGSAVRQRLKTGTLKGSKKVWPNAPDEWAIPISNAEAYVRAAISEEAASAPQNVIPLGRSQGGPGGEAEPPAYSASSQRSLPPHARVAALEQRVQDQEQELERYSSRLRNLEQRLTTLEETARMHAADIRPLLLKAAEESRNQADDFEARARQLRP